MVAALPGITRSAIDQSERSLWRYRKAFPIELENPISLGEGCTPLIKSSFRGYPCLFKLEWFSPTGSFKDRGASVMISLLHQQGVKKIVEDSSGNGGAAIAAYGAMAGMDVAILVPEQTQPEKIVQVRAYGAEVILVPGSREAAAAAAIGMAGKRFYASHNWHPMFLQGTKTLGYEIWEDLGFRAPDNIIIPGAAGSNIIGCHIAFKELLATGAIKSPPRIFLSQPSNCAPVHASFQAGVDVPVAVAAAPTIAEGTAIREPIRLAEMLAALRDTNGGTVAVSEQTIVDTTMELARQGIYVEPTSAQAAAAFDQLIMTEQISEENVTVVVLTGSGLKATSFYASGFDD